VQSSFFFVFFPHSLEVVLLFSQLFGHFSQSNMEPRSYMASITKSLLKTGWTRTDGQGRYVRWRLPPDVKIVVDMSDEKIYESKTETNNDDGNEGSSNNKDTCAAKEFAGAAASNSPAPPQGEQVHEESELALNNKTDPDVEDDDDDERGVDGGSFDASAGVGTMTGSKADPVHSSHLEERNI
jgi:hypothetical protein